MKQEHLAFIRELGLTKTESKVYLTLLESGESLSGTVASRTGVYRKNVYDALEVLSKKGFTASKMQQGKRYWIAMPPSRIQSLLKEKLDFFNTILPELTARYNEKKPHQTIEVYQGIEGIKSFNNLILREGNEVCIIGATGNIFNRFKYSIPTYLEEAKQKKMQAYILIASDFNQEGIKKFKSHKKASCRILPKDFTTPTQIYLFGEYSGILIWSEEPLAIAIKSKEIHKGFKTYFDFLWKLSKPL
ncbi:MAG TPA: helix-turn-helix domain-containing protein [Candidatus Nanoarchaeia archaeon]|nr:helix-turn-helix domain-containing protein [Candidatus Nanoarchaeia archaeon]